MPSDPHKPLIDPFTGQPVLSVEEMEGIAEIIEERKLLEAIHAEPRADGPRLAYADWKEAHGELERAELIRMQCQLPGLWGYRRIREREWVLAHNVESLEVKKRFLTLLRKYGNKWLKPGSRKNVRRYEWKRGMPRIQWYLEEFPADASRAVKNTPDHVELGVYLVMDSLKQEAIDWNHPVFERATALWIVVGVWETGAPTRPIPFERHYTDGIMSQPSFGRYTEIVLPNDDVESVERLKARFGDWSGYKLQLAN